MFAPMCMADDEGNRLIEDEWGELQRVHPTEEGVPPAISGALRGVRDDRDHRYVAEVLAPARQCNYDGTDWEVEEVFDVVHNMIPPGEVHMGWARQAAHNQAKSF